MKKSRAVLVANLVGIALLSILFFLIGKSGALASNSKGGEGASQAALTSTRSARDRGNGDKRWQTDAGRMDLLSSRLERLSSREEFKSELADVLLNSDKSEVERHLALLFTAWLQVNPQDALGASADVEKIRHDFSRMAEVFYNWAATNPDAAADLLRYSLDGKQLEGGKDSPFTDGIDPPAMLLAAVMGLANEDPEKAGKVLAEMKASLFQETAFSLLLPEWLDVQPEKALEWIKALEEGEARTVALGFLATSLANEENYPLAIAELSALENRVEREVALQTFVGQWTEARPEQAYEWVHSLPDEEMKMLLMPDVIPRQLLMGEPEVTAWLDEQEPSEAIDPTIISYSMALASQKPGVAMDRLETVTDPGQREGAYYMLADRWSRRDPAGLQNYLSGLTEIPPILSSFVEPSASE